MTTFYFVRHGKSEANLKDYIATDDSPLSKEGKAQARKGGRSLKKLDITVVATSPLPRARETAEIIAKELKIKDVEVIEELRERGLGGLEGHPADQPKDWYYSVEGEQDVEPRGIVIARCEAALARIKKLAEVGTVVVVGHAVSGYYLREVAKGKRVFEEFDPPQRVPNGEYVKITVADEPSRPVSRPLWMLGIAALVVIALVGWGTVATQQSTPTGVKQQTIPLAPSDYNDDPNLQGAIQKDLNQINAQNSSPSTGSPQTPANDVLQAGPNTLQAH